MGTNEKPRAASIVKRMPAEEPPHYECSFCGKGREEVEHLIAGRGAVYICNECVALCNALLAEGETPPAV